MNDIYQKNYTVIVEASRKVIAGEFGSIDEVEKWIVLHPDYTATSFGVDHLRVLKFYF